jgi:hypothetical protein
LLLLLVLPWVLELEELWDEEDTLLRDEAEIVDGLDNEEALLGWATVLLELESPRLELLEEERSDSELIELLELKELLELEEYHKGSALMTMPSIYCPTGLVKSPDW